MPDAGALNKAYPVRNFVVAPSCVEGDFQDVIALAKEIKLVLARIHVFAIFSEGNVIRIYVANVES